MARERIIELKITEVCSPENICLGDKPSLNNFKKILQPSPQFNLGTIPSLQKETPYHLQSLSIPTLSPRQPFIYFLAV